MDLFCIMRLVSMGFCFVDIKCDSCQNIWEYDKGSMMNDIDVDVKCPECGSKKWHRIFAVSATDVAGGKLGKGSTKFDNNVIYHPSSLSPNSKGKRIKTI